MYYLDHNATSPLRPEAREAVLRALQTGGNASSVHASGRAARMMIEAARDQVAALAGCDPGEVIFTSGATEANALALRGAIRGAADAEARITRLFVSAIEHDSVLANAADLAERVPGLRLDHVPVMADGVMDVNWLATRLREGRGRALIAVMAANNETGAIQPVAEVAALAREARALLLVDAVQAAGKMALELPDAHYITLSAHKLCGPQGAGALIVKDGAPFSAQILGGGQERRRRAGTENLSGIAGFGASASAALRSLEGMKAIAALRDRFEGALKSIAGDVAVFGANAPRLPNTSNFTLPGVAAEIALMALDLDGVCISSGSACSSGKVKPSHVLAAMGVPESRSASALRVSLGWNSEERDVDAALASLAKLAVRRSARAAA